METQRHSMKKIGRYEIRGVLGSGGMGVVYRGYEPILKREVAIKVPHAAFACDPEFRQRFLQEAQIAAGLKHPGIVKVIEFFQEGDLLCIVMEFINGPSLRDMLKNLAAKGQWISTHEAVSLVRMVCLSIDYAHRHGVLHRDLKPANILIEKELSEDLPYRTVLTDLGLAKLLRGGAHLTQDGKSMGTPAYMSPEQALGRPMDTRSDVYSLGILLYELCVGRLPFKIETISEAFRCHSQETPPPPRSRFPQFPEELERVILKALEKDPAQRFQSAAEMAQALGSSQETIPHKATFYTDESEQTLVEGVSLITEYTEDLEQERGLSIFGPEPRMCESSGTVEIEIAQNGRDPYRVVFQGNEMTIGREPGNTIRIDDQRVSRYHARVTFDGMDYYIEDLNSANGTFLGGSRLLPEKPEPWHPDKVVRIRHNWLRLILPETPTGERTERDQTERPPSTAELPPVGVIIDNKSLVVHPGSRIPLNIYLTNQTENVDHYSVSFKGIPSGWIPGQLPVVEVMPGEQAALSLEIAPPRSPKSRAAQYPVVISMESASYGGIVATEQVSLKVEPYAQFQASLSPLKARTGQSVTLQIHNQGNERVAYQIECMDRGNELAFALDQERFKVPEGQSAEIELTGREVKSRLVGGAQMHPYTVQVSPPSGDPQILTGEMVSQAKIPTWVLPILLTLCVGLAALLWPRPNTVTVPPLAGLGEEKAVSVLHNTGLSVGRRSTEPNDTYASGVVIRSEPLAGTTIKKVVPVDLVISSGRCIFIAPKLVGMNKDEALKLLEQVCQHPSCVKAQLTSTFNPAEAGQVIEQTPAADERVNCDTPVVMVVSDGLCQFELPDFIGQEEIAAREALDQMCKIPPCAQLQVTPVYDSSFRAGQITLQNPGKGIMLPCGDPLSLNISRGRCVFVLPDVLAAKEPDARKTIENACDQPPCASVKTHPIYDTREAGTVLNQYPAGNENVDCGSNVVLDVSLGSCVINMPGNLIGQTEAAVKNSIASLCSPPNCPTINVTREANEEVPAGQVIRSSPGASQPISCTGNVELAISLGSACALDTDSDQIPDCWETKYRLNPADPVDAAWDNDSDGSNNLQEYVDHTNPTKNETVKTIYVGETVYSVAFSPDNTLLAVGTKKAVQIWRVADGMKLYEFPAEGEVRAMEFIQYEQEWFLAFFSSKTFIKLPLTTMLNGKDSLIPLVIGAKGYVFDFSHSIDGKFLVAVEEGGLIEIWEGSDLATTIDTGCTRLFAVDFLPTNSQYFASSTCNSSRNQVLIFTKDGLPWQELMSHQGDESAYDIDFANDGSMIAEAGIDDLSHGHVNIWQTLNWEFYNHITSDQKLFTVDFSPDSAWLATAGEEKLIYLWRMNEDSFFQTLRGHQGQIFDVEISPDGTKLASGSEDGYVRIWEIE